MDREINSLLLPYPETRLNTEDNDEQDLVKRSKQSAATKSSCYKRQQRYREKQQLYVDRLESTVKHLRIDVDQQLIARYNAQKARACYDHQLTVPSQSNKMDGTNVVAVMRECMKAFESGVQAHQTRFLESVMRSDVYNGDLIGRDSILEQWKHLHYFSDVVLMLEHCTFSVGFLEQNTAMGHVNALLFIRLTRWNLATIFPNTVNNTRVRDKLLENSTVPLPMAVFFQFDEQGKVCRYDHTIDFVTGLYAVLRDYRDVVSMLESANIDTLGQIRGGLPAVATSRLGTSFCCDRRTRNRTELKCATARGNKLSVAYLLSSGDTDEQTAS